MSRKRNEGNNINVVVNILTNIRFTLNSESFDSTTAAIISIGAALLAVLLSNQEIGFSFFMEYLLHGLFGW